MIFSSYLRVFAFEMENEKYPCKMVSNVKRALDVI